MNKDGVFVELPKEKITFYGNTEEEKKANELIFDLTLENDALVKENKRLQQRNIELMVERDRARGENEMQKHIIVEKDGRIKKALEYINKMTENELNYIEYNGEEYTVCGSDFGEGAYIIKNILEGSDKE